MSGETYRVKHQVRILHITASSMIGGGPEHVWQLVRHLPPQFVSFVAAPDCEPYGPRFVQAVGADHVFTLPQRKISFATFWGLLHFVRRHRIDIVHSHGKGAGIYGRFAALLVGVASVHTFHGIHLPSKAPARQAYLFLERLLCGGSRACITVSESEAAQVRELRLCSDQLVTIHNGVEVSVELPPRKRPNPFSLVHVSRFDAAKNSLLLENLAWALRDAGHLNNCRFVVIGDGEERSELERRVREAGMGSTFHFVGTQPSIRPFLREAGCLISTSRWEGLPLAVLEAQSEGIPVAVTDVVGNRDAVVDGVTGFVYPLDDAATAVTRIGRLLEDERLWRNMGAAAHQWATKFFSVERMAEETAKLYASSLRQRRSRGSIQW